MQAGYQTNQSKSAKALKAAVRNAKKDKVLYGAVFKEEALYGATPSTSIATQTTSDSGTQAGNSYTLDVKKNQFSGAPLSVSALAALNASVRPEDSVSQSGSPTSSAASRPKISVSGSPLSSVISQLSDKLKQKNFGLKPRDSRVQNVEQVNATPTDSGTETKSEIPQQEIVAPAVNNSKPITPIVVKPVVQAAVPTPPESVASMAPTDLKSSMGVPSTGAATETKELEEEGTPAKIKRITAVPHKTTNIRTDDKIQTIAEELLEAVNKVNIEKGYKTQRQVQITSIKEDGYIYPLSKIIIKLNKPLNKSSYYSITPVVGSKLSSVPNVLSIDVYESIAAAIAKVNHVPTLYNPNPSVEETNGLGLDPSAIGSTRVVFLSNKSGKSVKKGQLYVMRPQLIKGHVRLYNKSGRPVVSRAGVSPSFQRIVRDIVQRNTFDATDYSNLESKETADANKFIEATKPVVPTNIDRLGNSDKVWQLKKRYEVLVGELSAGNSGKVVRDEMEDILRNLMRMHAIGEDKARNLIRSLRDF